MGDWVVLPGAGGGLGHLGKLPFSFFRILCSPSIDRVHQSPVFPHTLFNPDCGDYQLTMHLSLNSRPVRRRKGP